MSVMTIILFGLFGGWISRMCGGAPPKLPWGLDQWIYAIPYFVISLPATAVAGALIGIKRKDFVLFKAIVFLPYFFAFLGKRTGHGGGMDLGLWPHPRKDEALEFLIKPLHGKINEYWYDALLLAITGLAVTLVAGILIAALNPIAGLIVAVSGFLKAPAYMIGFLIYPKGIGRGIPHMNEATAIGEFLTGFFGYAGLGIASVMLAGI